MAQILVGTRDGLHRFDSSGNPLKVEHGGREVTTLAPEGWELWAILDGKDVVHTAGIDWWFHVATLRGLQGNCIADTRAGVILGTSDAHLYRIAGKGLERHLAARWGLQTTYYWEQTFRSKVETVIEHRYQPSLGGSVQTSLGDPAEAKEPWYAEYQQKYCIDKNFYAALDRARRAAKSPSGAPFSEERIDYILKTGANWSGPIKQFRLVVDKGGADNLVSFCGDDVKKIGETQLEMKKADYTPDGNLAVLILRKLPQQ